MNIFFRVFVALLSVTLLFSACKKQSGQGGTSSIQGKLFVVQQNIFTPIDSFYSGKENVYIVYGDNAYFGEKIESSYDGTFKFPYLKKGKYTIFSYSDCLGTDTTCHGGKKTVLIETEITDNHQQVDIGDLRIVKIQ